MSAHDGGQAFPRPASVDYVGNSEQAQDGMSLRDYFAAKATEADIQSFLPNSVAGTAELMFSLGFIDHTEKTRATNRGGITPDRRLRQWARYQHADAMLAARGQPAIPVEICGNCDTALPEGCGGVFKDDGPTCALNRTEPQL